MRFPQHGADRGDRAEGPDVDAALVAAVEQAVADVADGDTALAFEGVSAPSVLPAWRSWALRLPPDAATSAALVRLRPGRTLAVVLRLTWFGDGSDAGDADDVGAEPPSLQALAGAGRRLDHDVEACPWTGQPVHVRTTLLAGVPPRLVAAVLAVAGPGADCAQDAVELRRCAGAWLLRTLSVPRPPALDAVVHDTERVHAAVRPWAAP